MALLTLQRASGATILGKMLGLLPWASLYKVPPPAQGRHWPTLPSPDMGNSSQDKLSALVGPFDPAIHPVDKPPHGSLPPSGCRTQIVQVRALLDVLHWYAVSRDRPGRSKSFTLKTHFTQCWALLVMCLPHCTHGGASLERIQHACAPWFGVQLVCNT